MPQYRCSICNEIFVYDEKRYNSTSGHNHFVHVHLKGELERLYPNAKIEIEPHPEPNGHWAPDAMVLNGKNKPKALCDLYLSSEPKKKFWKYAKENNCEVIIFDSCSLENIRKRKSDFNLESLREWLINDFRSLRKKKPWIQKIPIYLRLESNGKWQRRKLLK